MLPKKDMQLERGIQSNVLRYTTHQKCWSSSWYPVSFSLNWLNSNKLIPTGLGEGYYKIKTDMKTNHLYEQKVLPEIGSMTKETSRIFMVSLHAYLSSYKAFLVQPFTTRYQGKQQSKIEKEEENQIPT